MGLCPTVYRFTRKTKCLLLLALCLCVLAWVAAFISGTVKPFELVPTQVQKWERMGSEVEAGLNTEPGGLYTPTELLQTKEKEEEELPKAPCPKKSPLLRGPLPLSFEPALTLGRVEGENGAVSGGQYQPADCVAQQSVAVLIPHRNREKHLLYLLHHLHPFLQRQQLHYAIYIIHQAGEETFNRAKLLNIGYLEALKDYSWDCFIFHDVDLVPENDHNLYTCDQQPKHLVVGRNSTGYKLRYKGYFGGVTALSRQQFLKVNGFPNSYWGWGGEDDDLRKRVELQRMSVVRPPAAIGRYTMVFHQRDNGNEVNKDRMRLLSKTSDMWKKDGLNSCTYQTLSVERPPLYINVTVNIGKPPSTH
ncbi:beta-1,4-galactosyltransferase 4 [Brachyhypopomus gauderio]|uniref:beta-1,4-galactosyltransferase 4 n=1 Tax=Brachyhypopomus gauderio TaxID=698409 RepID=UPI004042F5C9